MGNKWYSAEAQEPPVGRLVKIKFDDGTTSTSKYLGLGSWEDNLVPLYWGFIEEEAERSILLEASEIRGGNRQSDYGDAVQNFKRVARMASEITGKELTPEDCCAVQMAVKLCREAYKHKRDNLVDLCGYADILNLIKEAEE